MHLEFDEPVTPETYAYARASLIAAALRDRIEQIEADDDAIVEAFNFLDDLAATCYERAIDGGAEPKEVAEVYASDTLAVLGTALFQAGHREFDEERRRLDEITGLIRYATQDVRVAA